jgi:secretion/DNA translocation related TadE-like protein
MIGGETCGGLCDERGAATVLALAIVGTLVGLAGGGVAVAGAYVAAQRAAGAADAAALAAAEVASGAVPGYPCSEGARLAEANDARLESCDLEGLVVTVTTAVPYLGWSAQARARAGPPGSNSDSSAG